MTLSTDIQTDLLTVPYKGTAPAMNDLLGGQVDFMCDQTTNTTNQIKGGKVKVYGVTSKKRVASLPEVPTLDELGLKDFEVGIWHAFYAPKGTPKPVIAVARRAAGGAQGPVIKKRFNYLGTDPIALDKGHVGIAGDLSGRYRKWARSSRRLAYAACRESAMKKRPRSPFDCSAAGPTCRSLSEELAASAFDCRRPLHGRRSAACTACPSRRLGLCRRAPRPGR